MDGSEEKRLEECLASTGLRPPTRARPPTMALHGRAPHARPSRPCAPPSVRTCDSSRKRSSNRAWLEGLWLVEAVARDADGPACASVASEPWLLVAPISRQNCTVASKRAVDRRDDVFPQVPRHLVEETGSSRRALVGDSQCDGGDHSRTWSYRGRTFADRGAVHALAPVDKYFKASARTAFMGFVCRDICGTWTLLVTKASSLSTGGYWRRWTTDGTTSERAQGNPEDVTRSRPASPPSLVPRVKNEPWVQAWCNKAATLRPEPAASLWKSRSWPWAGRDATAWPASATSKGGWSHGRPTTRGQILADKPLLSATLDFRSTHVHQRARGESDDDEDNECLTHPPVVLPVHQGIDSAHVPRPAPPLTTDDVKFKIRTEHFRVPRTSKTHVVECSRSSRAISKCCATLRSWASARMRGGAS